MLGSNRRQGRAACASIGMAQARTRSCGGALAGQPFLSCQLALLRLDFVDRLKGPDTMEPDRAAPPGAGSSSLQQFARVALATALIAVGLWILFDFLPAL